MGVANS